MRAIARTTSTSRADRAEVSVKIETLMSGIAIVLSVVSLTWQVATWRRSGPVVKVLVSQSLPIYGNDAGDWHTGVTAQNTGRSPITVTSWGLRFPDGKTGTMTRNLPWSASLPHRLEPGADASWFIPTDDVRGMCAERGFRYHDLTAVVTLADGRTIAARRRGIGME